MWYNLVICSSPYRLHPVISSCVNCDRRTPPHAYFLEAFKGSPCVLPFCLWILFFKVICVTMLTKAYPGVFKCWSDLSILWTWNLFACEKYWLWLFKDMNSWKLDGFLFSVNIDFTLTVLERYFTVPLTKTRNPTELTPREPNIQKQINTGYLVTGNHKECHKKGV